MLKIREVTGGFWPIIRTIASVVGAIIKVSDEIEEGVNWFSENSRRY